MIVLLDRFHFDLRDGVRYCVHGFDFEKEAGGVLSRESGPAADVHRQVQGHIMLTDHSTNESIIHLLGTGIYTDQSANQ